MGLIREVVSLVGDTIGTAVADQWLEVLEPDGMTDNEVLVPARTVHKEKKMTFGKQKTDNRVSNGSVIHVYDNQMMILVDGGRIVDYSAEPGYFKVSNSTAPSMFNGEFKDTLKETFERFKFGGTPSTSQRVYYINTQEIKGIKYGTATPIMYFDEKYDAMFELRANGEYSIRITNPLLFYSEAIPRDAIMENRAVDIKSINSQYRDEFITNLEASLNQYSGNGVSINYIQSHSVELSNYLRDALDEEWESTRGMVVQAVAIKVSMTEESSKLMAMRSKGAMLKDASIQAGYIAAGVGEGIAAAGANEGGAMNGFVGMGMAMNAGGGVLGGYQQQQQMAQQQQQQQQQTAQQQMAQQQPVQTAVVGWACDCGNNSNTGKFCNNCGKPKPVVEDNLWVCSCGTKNTGKFCQECGSPKELKCTECGFTPEGKPKFCPNCGHKF